MNNPAERYGEFGVIIGPEESVAKVSDDVHEVIDGMRAWYSFLFAKRDFVNVAFAVLAIGFVLLLIATALGWFNGPPSPVTKSRDEAQQSAAFMLMLLGGLGGLIGTGMLLNPLRNRWFPYATFAIGQGVDRYQRAEKWRSALFIAPIVSLICGIFLYRCNRVIDTPVPK